MGDFFAFRKMITPVFIQIIFVLGLVVVVVAGIGAISQDQALAGILLLVFGALYWRIVCELIFVFFRINDTLRSIKTDTAGLPALAGAGDAQVSHGLQTHEPAPIPVAPVAAPAAPAAAALSPEGWYDDSERPGHKRWWDGTAWGARDDES